MALQGFFRGPGPYYQLDGSAPPGEGAYLVSDKDGVCRWAFPSPAPPATAEFLPVTPRPGAFDPANDKVVLAYATVNYRKLPATFFDSAGAQVAGSKVEVFVAELPLISNVTLIGGLAIPIPPVPLAIGDEGGTPFGGTVNVSVDGDAAPRPFFVSGARAGFPYHQLYINTGQVTATELRVEGFSFWYLSPASD